MDTEAKRARDRAEAAFKKKEQQLQEAAIWARRTISGGPIGVVWRTQ